MKPDYPTEFDFDSSMDLEVQARQMRAQFIAAQAKALIEAFSQRLRNRAVRSA